MSTTLTPTADRVASPVDGQRPPKSRRRPPGTRKLFVGLVLGVILIVAGLTFFPVLALGPIVEHLGL